MDTVTDPAREQNPLLGMRLLKVADVAERLGISESAVYEAARQNRIGGVVRIGRRLRFDRDLVEAWIARGGEALPGGWRHAT